ncbi:hypothetical protein EPA93_39215 [Ktedonosporobacter rubrisoli]|uniref:Uncharacterized protein n=1 Tax=Ktedonosporobacter rubrisoli TaxID=2509675 RepID=A0A4V0Z019_KTERU|nr:hypothetical protein [Ktedonosporobacter rubrisoli]QBD81681.1 hypothetical protein EPA93_39215 [Ktedonosporobacter rubrisoli]
MAESEMTRLMQQIEHECEAMKQALTGYAVTSRHDIIAHRHRQLDRYHRQLKKIVGEQQATAIAVDIYYRKIK